jgi:hypothetical protein
MTRKENDLYIIKESCLLSKEILPFWSKTDMDSVHKNFYLAPDLKKIKPKKVANDQKINFAR